MADSPSSGDERDDETLDGLTFSGERFAIPETNDVLCVVSIGRAHPQSLKLQFKIKLKLTRLQLFFFC